MHNFFGNSPKQQLAYFDICEAVEAKKLKPLALSGTRWLGRAGCVLRTDEQLVPMALSLEQVGSWPVG